MKWLAFPRILTRSRGPGEGATCTPDGDCAGATGGACSGALGEGFGAVHEEKEK